MAIKIYLASKLHHVRRWQALRDEWAPEFEISSSWIDTYVEENDTPDLAPLFWDRNQDDIFMCDYLIIFAVVADELRGALVEAGMALAYGKKVIVVGDNEGFGTWQYHPDVTRVRTMDEAKTYLLAQ